MGVGMRIVTVISVALISKAEFQDLSHGLKQAHIFVDRGWTRRGEIGFDQRVILGHTRMFPALSQYFQYGQALRGEAVAFLPQGLDDLLKSAFFSGHWFHLD